MFASKILFTRPVIIIICVLLLELESRIMLHSLLCSSHVLGQSIQYTGFTKKLSKDRCIFIFIRSLYGEKFTDKYN